MSQIETFEFEDDIAVETVEAEAETEVVESKEEVSEPETAEPTTGSKKEEWTLTAVMDEREKRQKAVKEAEELREKLKAYEKPDDDVSVFDDENAWKQKQDSKIKNEVQNVALNMSQAFAEEVFGAEKVAEATEWFKTEGVKSPYLMSQYQNAKLPYHAIVKMHDEERARLDPEAYKAKLKAEILAELKGKDVTRETPIPPSLASKRSAGNVKDTLPDDPEEYLNP